MPSAAERLPLEQRLLSVGSNATVPGVAVACPSTGLAAVRDCDLLDLEVCSDGGLAVIDIGLPTTKLPMSDGMSVKYLCLAHMRLIRDASPIDE